MPDTTDHPRRPAGSEGTSESPGWSGGGFVTGLLLGAAVGAGLALLFAPASGEETRRILRRRTRALRRDTAEGWITAREHTRRLLREKKEALRQRIDEGLERLDHLKDG